MSRKIVVCGNFVEGGFGIRLKADLVVDFCDDPLPGTKVAFGRLSGSMPGKKLNLLQLSSSCVAESCACPAQVMWGELIDSGDPCSLPDDRPDQFLANLRTHTVPIRLTRRKMVPSVIAAAFSHRSRASHPDWDRDGSDVAALSVKVYDRPVVVTLLKVSKRQAGQFRSTQPAAKEERQDGMVALSRVELPEATATSARSQPSVLLRRVYSKPL